MANKYIVKSTFQTTKPNFLEWARGCFSSFGYKSDKTLKFDSRKAAQAYINRNRLYGVEIVEDK